MSGYFLRDELRSTPSRKSKETLLTMYMLKSDLRVFEYAYNPYKNYNMGKFKDIDFSSLEGPSSDMFSILDKILNGEVKGKEARDLVEVYSQFNGDLIKLIISKDMKCGVSVKTINKVFPGSIPEFLIEKAKSKDIDKLKFPQLVQMKHDGVRVLVIKTIQGVLFKSSRGRNAYLPRLEKVFMGSNFKEGVLDCELIWGEGKKVDRPIIAGKFNSALSGNLVDESKMVLKTFDYLTLDEFKTQTCKNPLIDRIRELYNIVIKIGNTKVEITDSLHACSIRTINSIYSSNVRKGYEGVIVKDPESYYTYKRSGSWVKIKENLDADLKCFAYTKGTGKYKGIIGSLECKGVIDGKEIIVNVSSGLSDSERALDFSCYKDKIIEIKYNSVTKNKNNIYHSLFIPKFVCVRGDKEE